jgi:hypothetical protein
MTASHLSPDLPQRWRVRNPRSGREVVLAASPDVRYFDRYRGTERRSADDSREEIGSS